MFYNDTKFYNWPSYSSVLTYTLIKFINNMNMILLREKNLKKQTVYEIDTNWQPWTVKKNYRFFLIKVNSTTVIYTVQTNHPNTNI